MRLTVWLLVLTSLQRSSIGFSPRQDRHLLPYDRLTVAAPVRIALSASSSFPSPSSKEGHEELSYAPSHVFVVGAGYTGRELIRNLRDPASRPTGAVAPPFPTNGLRISCSCRDAAKAAALVDSGLADDAHVFDLDEW